MDQHIVKKLIKNAELLVASTLEINEEAKKTIDNWAGTYDSSAQISKALSLQLASIANGIAMQNQLLTLVLNQQTAPAPKKKVVEKNWIPNHNTGYMIQE